MTAILERALWLADQIDQMSKELERIKIEIRSEYPESTVLDLGEAGHIVVTVPDPMWVLRKGKSHRDCLVALGEADTNKVFKVVTQVKVDQEAVKELGSNPEILNALVGLLDQKVHTTRIGFRPGQEVDRA